jgi:hypothetical protein
LERKPKDNKENVTVETLAQMSMNYLTRKKRKTTNFGVEEHKMASIVVLVALGVLSNF